MKTPSVPALERGLAVMELLASSRAGRTLSEIARSLDLPKSSVHCLLVTLERHGYVNRNGRTTRYMFSVKLFGLGNQSLSGLPVRQATRAGRLPPFRISSILTQLSLPAIEPPADFIGVAQQSLDNVTTQAIDFLHVAELLRAMEDNLSGFETTVEK